MRRVSLRLLGGFQARLEPGLPLRLPTRKAQALLAYLALRPDPAHHRDSLAALLWPDRANEQARASLRHALYELRRAFVASPAVLLTEGDTVTVDADLIDLDVAAFTRLLGEDTPEALGQAATLYRGDLLAGLSLTEEPWEAWLREERARLRELAGDGLARLLAHQRRAGQLEAAIRTASQLLALDPLQEPVHRTLMRLHAGLGQRGAALRQYQHCVSALRSELGVEPEEETRQLYQEILQQRTGAERRARVPKVPETRPAETPLIGRDAETAQLRDALDRASGEGGGLLAILGEAGMGKSRLIEELIAHAKRRDARVLLGRAYESDQILLFGPVVDALRTGRVGQDPEVLDQLGPAWRAELARLLPEIAAPGAPPLPARVDYRRLFEMIAQVIAHVAARDTLLFVLEDLHWADELTLRLLAFLARRVPTERVLLVVTAREEELPDAALLRHTLEDLGRAGVLASLGLGPLSRRDTVALVARLTPPGAAARSERLGERVGRSARAIPWSRWR